MYKQLLLSFLTAFGSHKASLMAVLTTLSLVPLSTKSLALNALIANTQSNLKCAANRPYSFKNNEDLKAINFHEHLSFSIIGSRIMVKFSPHRYKQPIALESLAATLGYRSFNWVNYVEKDPHGMTNRQGNLLSPPYIDPPPGGYQYDAADNYPFYWDIEQCENCHSRHSYRHPKVKQKFALNFEDSPSDYRLKKGETVEFTTHLVGIIDRNLEQNWFSWDILSTFKWQLTNDATGRGQISLTAVDLKTSELPPSVRARIQRDGGIIPQLTAIAHRDKDNPHSHQCQLQSHQNRHRDSHL